MDFLKIKVERAWWARPSPPPPTPSPVPLFWDKEKNHSRNKIKEGKQNKSVIRTTPLSSRSESTSAWSIHLPIRHQSTNQPVHQSFLSFIHHICSFSLHLFIHSSFLASFLFFPCLLIYYFTFDRVRPGKFFIWNDLVGFQPTCAFCLSWWGLLSSSTLKCGRNGSLLQVQGE